MTPSPTPIDAGAFVNGISHALGGGTVGEIAGGALLLLASIFYFVFRSRIDQFFRDRAAAQAEADAQKARAEAEERARAEEAAMAAAQKQLADTEKPALLRLLCTLSDDELVAVASRAWGSDKVDAIIGEPQHSSPLSPEQRKGIYNLYGV